MRRIGTAVAAALVLVLVFALVAVGAALRMPDLVGAAWIRVLLLFSGALVLVAFVAGLLPLRVLRAAARDRDDLESAIAARREPGSNAAFPGLAVRIVALLRENRELAERATQAASGADREERLAAIGRLAAGLAHELRNPLTTILGVITLARESLVRDGLEGAAIAKDLDVLEAEARRCEAISESILAFSRTPRLQLAPVRLAALFSGRSVPDGVEVSFEVEAGEEGVEAAIADEVLLGRVAANLLRNAAEAGARRIRARASRHGANVRVTIADDGRGIPAAMIDHLFDAFATSKTGGLGLGLAICRGIVTAHGGTLTARNRPEGGAEFAVEIPVAGPAASAAGRGDARVV